MIVFASVVMVLAAFGFVLFPLFKRPLNIEPAGPGGTTPGETDDPLQEKKASLFSTIKELESDFELGSLSRRDYEQLRQSYEMKAFQTLRDIDQLNEERGEAISDEIEEKVFQLRGSAPATPVAGKTCASCGTQLGATDRYCHRCGNTAVPVCSACGTEVVPGDRFCSRCGTRLAPDSN